MTGVRRNGDGTVQIDLAFENLPSEAAIYASLVPKQKAISLGTVPAGETGNKTLTADLKGQSADALRVYARMPGANLVWWSDVLRP